VIDSLQGKTAVITGGASGLGLACAKLAAQHGMQVMLADVQADALAQAQQAVQTAGTRVLTHVVDVADASQMEAFAARVADEMGAPHWVFNNAGVASGGLIWEHSLADWQWLMGVNVWGVVHGVRLFTPMMLAAAKRDPHWRGHIVNTASMAGLVTMPNMGVYNVSKHAVVSLTETLYQDLQLVTTQVSASVLCPYFVPTGIDRSERNRPAHWQGEAPTASQRISQAMSEKAVASGKVSAEEVAHKVLEAIQTDRFYIYSHPKALEAVTLRMQAMVAGENPPDPFAARPDIGHKLREALTKSD
jgi:NAD(P)-dependent dehydrogenase (short-subunit alcohol dehydrogenase family)